MSNTLVIHPYDESTDFLCKAYEGYDFDVVRDYTTPKANLLKMVEDHDRIIMMGHGNNRGLFNPRPSFTCGPGSWYMVDYSFVDLLKEKETVSVWCYSDLFFKSHGIYNKENPMLHTGMIISEVSEEAYMLGKIYLDESQMLSNMNLFATSIHDNLMKSGNEMVEGILSTYVGQDPVTKFNRDHIGAF